MTGGKRFTAIVGNGAGGKTVALTALGMSKIIPTLEPEDPARVKMQAELARLQAKAEARGYITAKELRSALDKDAPTGNRADRRKELARRRHDERKNR